MVSSSFKTLLALAGLAASATAAPSGTYSSRFAARNPQRRAATTGPVSFGYFANWHAGSLGFTADKIPAKDLTHVLYSFMDSDKATGALMLSDPATDTGNVTSGTLGGQLGALFELKKANRHLKTLFSIGGWNYSQDKHFAFMKDPAEVHRRCAVLRRELWFDGVDIDYEAFAADELDDFVNLFKELREALDKMQKDKGDKAPYLLTSAVFTKNEAWCAKATEYLDYFLLMAYDFSGAWVNTTAYQSNLLADGQVNGGLSVESGVTSFLTHTPAERIVMGQPLYARTFAEATGYNQPYNGVGSTDGILLYKDLPASGDTVHEDLTLGAAYSLDPATKVFATYDTPGVTKVKSKYIKDKGLGGAMWWDLATDKTGADSLVTVAHTALGDLDSTENHINFPNSVYDNVKAAGGDSQTPGGGGEVSTEPPASTTPPTETSTPVPTSSPSTCARRRRA
ncbi:glycosyl hydrolases family 18-domain-containing protein [Auriculariales sp. MPI-PUGE-AT-0066]|nr:glycosyl hydrolases family 18-domain-containing protein [Auriculariales sp. MPI-PUGE-AT-0066]